MKSVSSVELLPGDAGSLLLNRGFDSAGLMCSFNSMRVFSARTEIIPSRSPTVILNAYTLCL